LRKTFLDAGNSLGADAMKTAEFSQAMNRATGLSVAAQSMFEQAFSKHLVTMNVPTRADVSSLAERLQAMEGRIEEIHLMLNERQGNNAPSDRRTKPTRNRRPPSAGDASPPEQF
jgi:TolA-binding protein